MFVTKTRKMVYKICLKNYPSTNLTIYKARRYIYIFIYLYHFTDTTASTLTRVSAKTVKDIKLKLF